jgi:hypothetical protein
MAWIATVRHPPTMARLTPSAIRALREGHGVVTRRTLLRLEDVTGDDVLVWVRQGRLTRLGRGVLGSPGLPDTMATRARIALANSGPSARLGPVTSLSFMGIEGFSIAKDSPLDIALPRSARRKATDVHLHHIRMTPADKATVEGMPALSAARSLIVRAADVPLKTLRVGIDDAVRKGWTSKSAIVHRAGELKTVPGAKLLRDLFNGRTMDAESEGERDFLPTLLGFDPAPELQVTDLVPNRRLDYAWRPHRYGLEYDGADYHEHDTGRDRDGLRDLEASAADVLVHRITWGMLVHDLDRTVELVWRTLCRRADQFRLPPPTWRKR